MKKIKKPTKRNIAKQLEMAEARITKLEKEALERHRKAKVVESHVLGLEVRVGEWVERIRQIEVFFVEPTPEPVEVTADVAHTDEPATMSEQTN
jgi:predicted  nucleic acid-binding Zn-ribbon protein